MPILKDTISKTQRRCDLCHDTIPKNTRCGVSPNLRACIICWPKYESGKISYSSKAKAYILTKDKVSCDKCKNPVYHTLDSQALCEKHWKEVVTGELENDEI